MTSQQRLMALALVLTLLMGAAAGCTGEGTAKSPSGKTATLLFSFTASTLDPHNDWVSLRAGITETLVKLDENLSLQPHLASSWEQKDPHTWVFTIRNGITFHDGTELDAQAVKTSLERSLKVSKRNVSALKIESMEADQQTLTIRTQKPHPALPSELVNPTTSIVSTAAEAKMGTEAFNLEPVGTGPFQVSRFTPDVEIQLKRFDRYWDGPAKLETAIFKFNTDPTVRMMALQSGEADIAYHLPPETVSSLESDPDLKVVSLPGLRSHFLLYNMQSPVMQDKQVRQALDALLDRETVAQEIMHGHAAPAGGPFNPKFTFGDTGPAAKHDLDRAQKLLTEAGWVPGDDGKRTKDGHPLSLSLVTYASRPELPLIAQLLQAEAAKLGIAVDIRIVDDPDAYLHEHQDWDLAVYSNLTAPRGDGGYFLNVAYLPQAALNPGQIHIEPLNELIHELNRTTEQQRRDEITRQAVAIIQAELPQSFLVYPNVVVGMNKRVTGWAPGPEEYYLLTHRLDVE